MKIRADKALFLRQLVQSRSRAQDLILRGLVFVEGKRLTSPAQPIDPDSSFHIQEDADSLYVSRAGIKLAAALDHFHIDPSGKVVADIGASTGGFCDVLLRRGAKQIFAIDVGSNQMAASLAADPRILLLEKTNARYLDADSLPAKPEMIVCDVSFISLTLALPAILSLAKEEANLIALIKPQFEAGKAALGKGGIIRSEVIHQNVCLKIEKWLTQEKGWESLGLIESPIQGGDGNKEFLIAARKPSSL